MNSGQKDQSGEPAAETPEAKKQYTKQPNKTAFWILLMLWPPLALIMLGALSGIVNFIGSNTPSTSEILGTSGELSAAATPAWVDSANFLIVICVGVALLGVAVNFTIGIVLVMKRRIRFDSFF